MTIIIFHLVFLIILPLLFGTRPRVIFIERFFWMVESQVRNIESVGYTHVAWKIYHISIIIYLPHDREGPIPSLPKFPFNT